MGEVYICECGKEFSCPQAFNGHRANCREYYIRKYGTDEMLLEHQKHLRGAVSKHGEKKRDLNKAKRQEVLVKWISEQHTCEKCGKIMTEKFGSGRFCSRACANSRIQTDEQNKKRSNKLLGRSAKLVESRIKYKQNIKFCCICGKPLDYSERKRKTCSDDCKNKLLSVLAKERINERGYNLNITVKSRYKYGTYKNIYCDSSWELAFVIYCIDNGLNIIRNTQGFDYYIDGEKHLYFPDFIVNGEYYEIKGYHSNLVDVKLKYFPYNLTILGKYEIKKYLQYCVDKYGENFTELYDLDAPSYLNK